ERIKAYARKRYKQDPERYKKAVAEYTKTHPQHPEYRRERKHGKGSEAHFEIQIKKQRNRCAICRKKLLLGRGTHRDHNHKTKKWRGALCPRCNLMLGLF